MAPTQHNQNFPLSRVLGFALFSLFFRVCLLWTSLLLLHCTFWVPFLYIGPFFNLQKQERRTCFGFWQISKARQETFTCHTHIPSPNSGSEQGSTEQVGGDFLRNSQAWWSESQTQVGSIDSLLPGSGIGGSYSNPNPDGQCRLDMSWWKPFLSFRKKTLVSYCVVPKANVTVQL